MSIKEVVVIQKQLDTQTEKACWQCLHGKTQKRNGPTFEHIAHCSLPIEHIHLKGIIATLKTCTLRKTSPPQGLSAKVPPNRA